jgi:hypothetical protein
MDRCTSRLSVGVLVNAVLLLLVYGFSGTLLFPIGNWGALDFFALLGLGVVLGQLVLVARLQFMREIAVAFRLGLEALIVPLASYLNCTFSNETPSPRGLLLHSGYALGAQVPTLVYGIFFPPGGAITRQFRLATLFAICSAAALLVAIVPRLFAATYPHNSYAATCLTFSQGSFVGLSGVATIHLSQLSRRLATALLGSVIVSVALGSILLGVRDGGFIAGLETASMVVSVVIVISSLPRVKDA